MAQSFIQNVRIGQDGLIPAVIQDVATSEVLGLCYLDNEGLMRTLQTGEAPANLKNESLSRAVGPRRRLVDVRVNADGDSLTVIVEGQGGADGEKPLSLMQDSRERRPAGAELSLVAAGSLELGIAINDLYGLITDRRQKRPEGSYTTYLFNSGLDKILKKIAEEAGEVIIASKNRSSGEIVSELADLIYHLVVLMVERDVKLSDVQGELSRRASGSRSNEDAGGSNLDHS